MATYKKIVDVETVAEATESMNVLVEDAGSLKKMSMENLGGGGGTVTFIHSSSGNITDDSYFLGKIAEGNDISVNDDTVVQAMNNGIVYVETESQISQIIGVTLGDSCRYTVSIMSSGPSLLGFSIYDNVPE